MFHRLCTVMGFDCLMKMLFSREAEGEGSDRLILSAWLWCSHSAKHNVNASTFVWYKMCKQLCDIANHLLWWPVEHCSSGYHKPSSSERRRRRGVGNKVPVVGALHARLGQAGGRHQGRGEEREARGRRRAQRALPADLPRRQWRDAPRHEQVVCESLFVAMDNVKLFFRFNNDFIWYSARCTVCMRLVQSRASNV